MQTIITHPHDPYFRVIRDLNGCSPNPALSIWKAQHTCVKEETGMIILPKELNHSKAQDAIIRNQLKVEHWSVLRFGFAVFEIVGFPHDTIMQMRTHQDSAHLVQSSRYTSDRFIKVADGLINVEEVFYFPPVGIQRDRLGDKIEYTEVLRESDKLECKLACKQYKQRIEAGQPPETARRMLPQNFRQDYSLACDLEALFHLLDQRTKKDVQLECRILADMLIEACKEWIPEFIEFYISTRYSKARLTP